MEAATSERGARWLREPASPWSSSSESEEEEIPCWIQHRAPISWLLLCIYFLVGVFVLAWQQQWYITTALYVVVQIVTTVGYGDVPISSGCGSKAFMSFYVLLGTVLVATFLNRLFESLLETAERRLDDTLEAAEQRLQEKPDTRKGMSHECRQLLAAILVYLFFVATWTLFFATYEWCSCSYGRTRIVGCSMDRCRELGTMRGFGDAIYEAIITFSTVGFGDVSPETPLGRCFAALWMILGVLSFGNLVAAVSAVLHHWRESYQQKQRVSRRVFDAIDSDGNGSVNQFEFLQYVLLREGKVSKDSLDRINHIFHQLDADQNGRLTYDEIHGKLFHVDL